MKDYREILPDYVCDQIEPGDYGRVSECPHCHRIFCTPDFAICECKEGEEFFGVCPCCGSIVKFSLYFDYDFSEYSGTPEEFEEWTGETIPKGEDA